MSFRVISANSFLEHSLMVNDLIDSEFGVWKKAIICHLFHSRDAELILLILLAPSLSDDVLIWHYTKSSSYSVNSAYHLVIECIQRKNGGIPPGFSLNISRPWKLLWRLNVSYRVRVFMLKL